MTLKAFGPALVALCALLAAAQAAAAAPRSAELKDLTWIEVRDAITEGYKTVLVPTGGIEQNGPHMILGKHDYLVAWAANRIALEVGQTLVAPVVSYVPEGSFDPPGTLGVSETAFASVLEGIARSLKVHGFTLICFMGDHGGSQNMQRVVAAQLSEEWQRQGVRVVSLDDYYAVKVQEKWLEAAGEPPSAIGQHAGIIDTSELMAIHPAGVDLSQAARPGLFSFLAQDPGNSGDPARSSAERGQALIMMRIEPAVAQIRALRSSR